MPKYRLKALTRFTDAETGAQIERHDIVETASADRAVKIINLGLGELVEACHEKQGKRVLIHQTFLYKIGGIETANRHLARAFADYNIGFIFGDTCGKPDMRQMMELAKTCDVYIDDGKRRYETDILIFANYDSAPKIIDRAKAGKVYQQIHADFENLTKRGGWQYFKWAPHPRIDRILTVSERAQIALKNKWGYESTVVPNVLTPTPDERLVFLVLSRATAEKGMERVIELCDRFNAAGKDFVFFVASTIDNADSSLRQEIEKRDRIVLIEPSVYSQEMLRAADYLVQLSHSESYCYSVREALQRQVPVIVSDIPIFNELVQDGKNGFIIADDYSNLDVDKIFSSKLKFKPYTEQIPAVWYKVLQGEL